jgi:UDP-N-acetylglucosamine 2-epimerase (non-hydrolysing)
MEGFYKRIPVGHLEAGLRTDTKMEPFPEEVNRRMISVIASLNFAPTSSAAESLKLENISPQSIFITGNTGIDTLLETSTKLLNGTLEASAEARGFQKLKRKVLVTCHRRESFGEPIKEIMKALAACAEKFPEVQFIFPMHPNPNVLAVTSKYLGKLQNFQLIEPLNYVDLVSILNEVDLIVTDSGGLQEEAPSLGKKTIVMREVTERPEAVSSGYSELVGTSFERIVESVSRHLDSPEKFLEPSYIFGDGSASKRIVQIVTNFLKSK